ncbi:flavodoxin [Clostridium sp. D2Q-14]|uniref:flavodoxin domain-containing protein n=1 Tax=Anaeromonas gelatinilytica TaxID=2683194 RepID=UPI00193C7D71|nr:flavodoxin domain-containing protein [Anaeromonas gelatinilytica]MBS4535647.1 flavodoxin [Anaeromonas gelatinilytica]
MKTLILYCSDHGTTEKCANLLKNKINGNVNVSNLKKNNKIEIANYDTVIIGGSVHMGNIQKTIVQFLQSNKSELLKKNLALFLCCGQQDNIDEYFKNFFPKDILEHSLAKINMGYSYDFDKLGFMKKMIIKKVAKVNKSEDKIKYENIDLLAKKINNI